MFYSNLLSLFCSDFTGDMVKSFCGGCTILQYSGIKQYHKGNWKFIEWGFKTSVVLNPLLVLYSLYPKNVSNGLERKDRLNIYSCRKTWYNILSPYFNCMYSSALYVILNKTHIMHFFHCYIGFCGQPKVFWFCINDHQNLQSYHFINKSQYIWKV